MSTPNPPSGQAVPTEYARDTATGPQHAAPHGLEGLLAAFRDDILREVRAILTPAHVQELAGLCREVAAGSKDAVVLVAWLGAHGL